MLQRLLLTVASLLLLAGLFSPMIGGPPSLETKSFFTWGGPLWDGTVVLCFAGISLILAVRGQCKWAALIGIATMLLVYSAYAEFLAIQEASRSRGDAFAHTAGEITLANGLWIMSAAAGLMVLASVIPARAERDRRQA